jgi:ABC-2 type transport system permease protein
MRNTLAIARKELNVYFTTPMAYVMFCGTTVIASYMFIAFIQRYSQLSLLAMQAPQMIDPTKLNLTDLVMAPLVGNVGVIFIFVVPFLTMRLMAEEKRQHTLELLMTTPVRPTEIVLGKFFAGFGVVALTIAFTLLYPVVLHLYGASAGESAPIEWNTVLVGYLGLLCWGAATVAIGLFISSLTENQAIAALVTFVVLLLTWLVGWVGEGAGPVVKAVLDDLSSITHLRGLTNGELALKDLVYFASLTVLGLFLSQRAIESSRWA